MNILLFRNLSVPALTELQTEFGSCNFRMTSDTAQLEAWLDWPDAIFGNAPAPLLARSPGLRWLQIVSSGFDEYLALAETKVQVTTGHGVHAPVIAQHVLLMFLHFVRGQHHFAASQRRRIWDRQPAIPRDPSALIVGIIGYGAVGQAISRLLRPLGTRVIATKLTPAAPPADLHALYPWERLDELLAISDHIVLTLPLTDATRGLLDADRLARMKPGAVLHNIARGQLVHETALITALQSGRMQGAALDVFAEEPLPDASPLWDLPNVVITPHIAGHHRDLGRLMLERFKENLRSRLKGEPLEHAANFVRGY